MKLQLVVHVPFVLPDREPQREPEHSTETMDTHRASLTPKIFRGESLRTLP